MRRASGNASLVSMSPAAVDTQIKQVEATWRQRYHQIAAGLAISCIAYLIMLNQLLPPVSVVVSFLIAVAGVIVFLGCFTVAFVGYASGWHRLVWLETTWSNYGRRDQAPDEIRELADLLVMMGGQDAVRVVYNWADPFLLVVLPNGERHVFACWQGSSTVYFGLKSR